MSDITPEQARNAVNDFLTSQIDTKTEKELKQLGKALEENDLALVSELQNKIQEVKSKYELETWMDRAANWMSKHISFGTHISKGIHSASKGDNINFTSNITLPSHVVGHQSIETQKLDGSGNAAALPLFSFFNYEVENGKRIRDFIIEDNISFQGAFSKSDLTSKDYFRIFRNLLIPTITKPKTSEFNKQILWYLGTNNYICLIPLFPSILTNELYEKVNHLKFSEAYTQARKNRSNIMLEQIAYPSIPNLAVINIGGSNPQVVGQLMSKQLGCNYLLPSLPPKLEQKNTFTLSKFSQSIFDSNNFKFHMRDELAFIFEVVKDARNNVDVRDKRKDAIDRVLHKLFAIAENLQNAMPAGWSKDYQLEYSQKLWLDPRRAELENEAEFADDYVEMAWQNRIIQAFANWLNVLLREEFEDLKAAIGDSEHNKWQREIEAMKNRYERLGKGVFA